MCPTVSWIDLSNAYVVKYTLWKPLNKYFLLGMSLTYFVTLKNDTSYNDIFSLLKYFHFLMLKLNLFYFNIAAIVN